MAVMTFSCEADMTAAALRAAECVGAPPDAHVFLEYESTNGIADVVFATFDEGAIRARDGGPLAAAYTDRTDVAVLLALDDTRDLSLAQIAGRAGLRPSTVASRLRVFAGQGSVERVKSDAWQRQAPFPCRLAAVTALELKLSAWRRALDQAARYRAFAERSLAVFSDRHGQAARAQAHAFALNRVGCVLLSPRGHAETVVDSEAIVPFDPIARFVAGERLWLNAQSRTVGHVIA